MAQAKYVDIVGYMLKCTPIHRSCFTEGCLVGIVVNPISRKWNVTLLALAHSGGFDSVIRSVVVVVYSGAVLSPRIGTVSRNVCNRTYAILMQWA